ncbi:MAG: YIP1 family protein [Deltaproteobacteria bacterium]
MSLIDKMIRAAKLDVSLYEEVERDESATKQALMVVVLGSICSGIGSIGALGTKGLVTGVVSGIVGWVLWSLIIFLIGVKALKHTSDMGELLRCLGFAFAPNILSIVGIVPVIGGLARFAVSIWVLVAFIVAVRQALDCETGRAILVSVIGFIIFMVISFLFLAPMAG